MTLGGGRAGLGGRLVGALHYLLSLGPVSPRRACLYGWPDYEENSLWAAVALAEQTPLAVTLLADDPAAARRYLAVANPRGAPVEIVPKRSLRGLLRASRAAVLLFTHGLYGSPDLTGRKLVINLWHGFGPKANDNVAFSARIPFDAMTCNTPVWARAAARSLGAPEARLVQSGNPRQAALHLPPDPAALARLGLAGSRYVLWMPTYRSANGAAGQIWRDAPALSRGADDPDDAVSALAELADRAGVELVVKPHPLDGDRYEAAGLRVVTTEQIFDSGMTLYQLIGSSAGMISDYSSVWVEYLDLDRPLLLFCPDISDYVSGRGLSPPVMTDIAADLIVQSSEDVRPFLSAVRSAADWRPQARAAVRRALQLGGEGLDHRSLGELVMAELHQRGRGAAPVGPGRAG